ncbi:hypothetical protein HHI36_015711 [Cryptolaemus montrouzieri]|uniref:Uncharacterized protein n=1 Tax=Cryptolaemus montrouzieri TaxID=559131 RepID=A0ABD2N6P5_9CUCU
MPIPEIEEILQKYKNEEDRVEKLLNEKFSTGVQCKGDPLEKKNQFLSFHEVKERNRMLLQDFEAAKGRLRSKAIYCPTESNWGKACRYYQENPSLPVTTWKCRVPVYV